MMICTNTPMKGDITILNRHIISPITKSSAIIMSAGDIDDYNNAYV